MATANLTAQISTKGAAKTESELKKISKQAANTEKSFDKMSDGLKSVSKNAGATAAAITGPLGGISSRISAVTTILTSGTAAASSFGVALAGVGFITAQGAVALDEYDVNLKRVNATLQATGEVVGFTAVQLQEQASALALATLTSTQEVQKAQAELLTFNRVIGDSFTQAIELSQDLAEAGFGSITSNAVLLGKALQDPIKGVSSLTRVGVTLSANQKEIIANSVEQNDVFAAQAVILEALQGQVGGVAAAVASGTAAGAVDTLGQRFEELSIEVAKSTGALDTYKQIIDGAINVTESLIEKFDETPSDFFAKTLEKTIELNAAQARLAEITDTTSLAYRQQAFEIVGIESALRGLKNETKELAEEQNKQIAASGEAAKKEAEARKAITAAVEAESKIAADKKAEKEEESAAKTLAIAQRSADRELEIFNQLNQTKLEAVDSTELARIEKANALLAQELITEQQHQDALTEIEFNAELSREQIRADQTAKKVEEDAAELERKRALFEEQNKIAINAGQVLSSSLADGLLSVAKSEAKLGDVIVSTVGKVADSVATAILQEQIQKQVSSAIEGAAFLTEKTAEVTATTAQAGLNAFAATAAIPVVGPALAPAAAATATAGASALGAGVIAAAAAREQGGNLSAGQVSTIAERNELEVIAPASASRVRTKQQMRDIMGGESGGGSANVSIVVIDQSPGNKEFTTDEDSEGRTILLIREVVSNDLQSSNSDIAKARKESRGTSGF